MIWNQNNFSAKKVQFMLRQKTCKRKELTIYLQRTENWKLLVEDIMVFYNKISNQGDT